MRLGLGLYRHMLDDDHFAFARQAGASDLVVHLVDYQYRPTSGHRQDDQPVGDLDGWGVAGQSDELWDVDALRELRQRIEAHGLRLAAIENLDPAHWSDILLDGPRKAEQLEGVKQIVRNLGAAGIPTLGYNFSLAGVASRIKGPFARGGADAVGMDGVDDTPVPRGMVWNMWYDLAASDAAHAPVTHEQLWDRLRAFLQAVVPVAEQAGVTLAAHPDDPPVPWLRQMPRLVYQPWLYDDLIAATPSQANQLELCVGTLAEMTEGSVEEAVARYASQQRIAYVHLRNVHGKAPHYRETFIDEGDVDVARILAILQAHDFHGVLIPDHAPQMTCNAPWHAGMAHAMGYIKALLDHGPASAGSSRSGAGSKTAAG